MPAAADQAEMDRVGAVRLLFVLDGFEGWEPRDDWSDLSFYVEARRPHRAHRDRRGRTVAKRDADVRGADLRKGAGGVLRRGCRRPKRALAGVVTECRRADGTVTRKDTRAMNLKTNTRGRRPCRGARPRWCSRRHPPGCVAAGQHATTASPDAAATGKPAPPAPAQPAGGDGRRRHAAPVDGGWPRVYDLPSGGSILRLSAADRQLGQAGAHGRVQRRVAPHQGRRQAGARHDQARSRHEGGR